MSARDRIDGVGMHTATWDGSDGWDFNCHAPLEAHCRSKPPVGCECEAFVIERVEGGWAHRSVWDLGFPDPVMHRHVPSDECAFIPWVTDYATAEEVGPDSARIYYDEDDTPVPPVPASGSVGFIWDDGYSWEFVATTTKSGDNA